MAEHVRRAIAWTVPNAQSFGGDAERVYLSDSPQARIWRGVALLTPWRADFELPDNVIKGAVLSSGMYDLQAGAPFGALEICPPSPTRSKSVSLPSGTCTDQYAPGARPRHLETRISASDRDFAAALKAADKPVSILSTRTTTTSDDGDVREPVRPVGPRGADPDAAALDLSPSSLRIRNTARLGSDQKRQKTVGRARHFARPTDPDSPIVTSFIAVVVSLTAQRPGPVTKNAGK